VDAGRGAGWTTARGRVARAAAQGRPFRRRDRRSGRFPAPPTGVPRDVRARPCPHRAAGTHARRLAGVRRCTRLAPFRRVPPRPARAQPCLGGPDCRPRQGARVEGIKPHFVPSPAPEETDAVDGIPCTSVSRTLIDLAGLVGEGTLRRAVEQTAVLRVLDPSAIDAGLARARRRGAPTLRSILAEWRADPAATPILRSRLEARALALIERHSLSRPTCNAVVSVGGRRIEIDLLWPDRMVGVELDGRAFHEHRRAIDADRIRDRELLLAGYRVLRFTWRQLDREPERFLGAIRSLVG
jgi:Protein of unknown function (DUF559)